MEMRTNLEKIARKYIFKPLKVASLMSCVYFANNLYGKDINIPADYSIIQAGINAAVGGDSVIVASGIYNEVVNLNGKAITLRGLNGAERTIIDGSGLGDSVVKCINGEGADTIIDGFTITGGNGSNFGDFYGGGGMINANSRATISNCVFMENSSFKATESYINRFGGGIFNIKSNPTITDCTFFLNLAFSGGGIANYDSNPKITNCIIKANNAINDGGGIWNNANSAALINNCIIDKNISAEGGGAYNNGDINFLNCTFFGNKSRRDGYGGLYGEGGLASITNCIFWNNDRLMCCNGFIVYNYSNIQNAGPNQPGIGNIDADPLFIDSDNGDFRLQANSPCIDTGDPSLRDSDGTRSDMGALFYDQETKLTKFTRGDANDDGKLDISDPIQTSRHLFFKEEANCLDAHDSNDDGKLDSNDILYSLDYLFNGGFAIPEPFLQKGFDNTLDPLTCISYEN